MEMLSKIIRSIASIPVVGGLFVFLIGFFPLLVVIPFNLSNGLSMIIGGLLMAAWCYFLSVKKVINIVTPLIPIPLWILGVVMAIGGVYGIITNKWDVSETSPEVSMPKVNQETKSPINESAQLAIPESTPDVSEEVDQNAMREQANKLEQDLKMGEEKKVEFENALEKAKQEAKELAPKVIAQMQASLDSIKKLKGTEAGKQYEAIMKSQNPENPMTLDDAIAEMEKTIEEYKSNVYSGE